MSACKAYDGKIGTGFFKTKLGVVCRLHVARYQAAVRKTRPCVDDGSPNPDWNNKLSDIPLWIHARELYKRAPAALRDTVQIEQGGYNNSTIYGTYVLGFTNTVYQSGDKPRLKYVFNTYFCQAKNRQGTLYYQPYFYVVSKQQRQRHEKDWTLVGRKMVYVARPPFTGIKVLQQLPRSVNFGVKVFKLGDFNGDGHKDLIYAQSIGFKDYRPGVCLYTKGSNSCTVVTAQKTVASKIFFQRVDLQWKPKHSITIVVREKSNRKPADRFVYRYRKDGFYKK